MCRNICFTEDTCRHLGSLVTCGCSGCWWESRQSHNIFIVFSDLEQIELALAASSKGTLLERKKNQRNIMHVLPCDHWRLSHHLRTQIAICFLYKAHSFWSWPGVKLKTKKPLWLSWCKGLFLTLDFLPSFLRSHRHLVMSQNFFWCAYGLRVGYLWFAGNWVRGSVVSPVFTHTVCSGGT